MAPAGEASAGEAAEDDAEEDVEALEEVSWIDIRSRLHLDNPRMARMLDLFEQRYSIASPSEAFVQIRPFLGEYLVQEFDHDSFCQDVGASEANIARSLVSDLGLASSLMLRLAVAIAKAFHLEMTDWADTNQACSDALNMVPSCYALQRMLPGALNVARNFRFAPASSESEEVNPWKSEEGRRLFEKEHGLTWDEVELFTSQDQSVNSCFAGAFVVRRVTPVQKLAIVVLEALRVDEAPAGFPAKNLAEDDTIMWEVEESLGNLLEPGIAVDADWCEMQNDLCFVSLLRSVAPEWCCDRRGKPGDAEDVDEAEVPADVAAAAA